jgi:hypothetical protein
MASSSGISPVMNSQMVLLLSESFLTSSTPPFNGTLHCFSLHGLPSILLVTEFSKKPIQSCEEDPATLLIKLCPIYTLSEFPP